MIYNSKTGTVSKVADTPITYKNDYLYRLITMPSYTDAEGEEKATHPRPLSAEDTDIHAVNAIV